MACCRKVSQNTNIQVVTTTGTGGVIGSNTSSISTPEYTNRSAVKSNRSPIGRIAYSCPTCGSKSILKTCPICGTVINS